MFERAVELDPAYAVARANLGMTYIMAAVNREGEGVVRPELERGLAEVREAVRLQPDLPLAYQVLSCGLSQGGDHAGGMRAAERAVELNPNDPDSLMSLAKAQLRFGSHGAAVDNAALARRLHPLTPARSRS